MPARRRSEHGNEGRRLAFLVLDDEADMLFLTREWLAHAFTGCDVVDTRSWKAALALVQERAFDVVISDHRMPGMDGYTFLTKIADVVPPGRCILMTAYQDKGLQERTLAAGMDFSEKSADPATIVEAVERVLGRGARQATAQPR